jgi:hypothetical protein
MLAAPEPKIAANPGVQGPRSAPSLPQRPVQTRPDARAVMNEPGDRLITKKETQMKCPYCKEEINKEATRCKHCGGEFLYCNRCKMNVAIETKSKFVGMARGGTKDVKKCAICGAILYGPKCFVATAAYGTPMAPQV